MKKEEIPAFISAMEAFLDATKRTTERLAQVSEDFRNYLKFREQMNRKHPKVEVLKNE